MHACLATASRPTSIKHAFMPADRTSAFDARIKSALSLHVHVLTASQEIAVRSVGRHSLVYAKTLSPILPSTNVTSF
jgi:hypothetical protein